MKFSLTRLKNGLRVLTVAMPTLKSATVTIWVGIGSRYEDKKISGISHFLEHMAFKGSKKRPSARKISETIDGIGGEFNAGTTREWTNFYIKARVGLIETAFDVIGDMLLNPILKKEDIERERGVILEEIAMKDDTPLERVGDVFTRLIFVGNPLGQDIIGTKETVRCISKKDFEKYRLAHYGGANMVLTCAGGVKEKDVIRLSERYFAKLSKKRREKTSKFIAKQTKPQVLLESKKSEQAHFILGFLGYQRDHKNRYIESVLTAILGQGMSSRLFTEIREKRGLAYAVSSSVARYVDTGLFATYAGVVIKRADEAIKVVLDQHYKIASRENPVSEKELKKAKEFIKGRMALALEDTRVVNDFFGQKALFLPKIMTPEEIFAEIDKVTAEDVIRVAKEIFKPEKLNLAIIGPYKSQSRFERLLA